MAVNELFQFFQQFMVDTLTWVFLAPNTLLPGSCWYVDTNFPMCCHHPWHPSKHWHQLFVIKWVQFSGTTLEERVFPRVQWPWWWGIWWWSQRTVHKLCWGHDPEGYQRYVKVKPQPCQSLCLPCSSNSHPSLSAASGVCTLHIFWRTPVVGWCCIWGGWRSDAWAWCCVFWIRLSELHTWSRGRTCGLKGLCWPGYQDLLARQRRILVQNQSVIGCIEGKVQTSWYSISQAYYSGTFRSFNISYWLFPSNCNAIQALSKLSSPWKVLNSSIQLQPFTFVVLHHIVPNTLCLAAWGCLMGQLVLPVPYSSASGLHIVGLASFGNVLIQKEPLCNHLEQMWCTRDDAWVQKRL